MTSQSNTQVGRGMSYRKPVPVYVPSPPSSPTIPLQALGLENNSQSQIPPLPENWREVITTKIQEANSSRASFLSFQKALTFESDPLKSPRCTECSEDQKPVTFPPPSLKYSHRRRGLPTHFRPPTPPLPSLKSPQTLPETAAHTALPMLPSSPGPSLEDIQLPADTRSLTSFQTDGTVVSHGTGRIWTSWSRSIGTLAYGEFSIHPKKDFSDTIDSSPLLCCPFLRNVIENLKDFCRCK